MKPPHHLYLERIELAPSAEWTAAFPGWCVFRVHEGQGYWLGESGALEAGAGCVGVLSPLREGSFRSSQLGPAALQVFRFAPEIVDGLLTPAERDCFEALAARPAYAARVLAADLPGAIVFSEFARRESGGNALLQRAQLMEVIATIFARELLRPPPPDSAFLSARQRLRLLVNQIPETEFLKFTPAEMAGQCGSSVTHFNRSFRKLFGMSLGRKQELIRLQKARQALIESTTRVEAVAGEAGFADVKDFSRAFKREFGVSPTEWRHPKLRKTKAQSNGDARKEE